jgi:hypothetical protein
MLFDIDTEEAFARFYFTMWKRVPHKYIFIITNVFLALTWSHTIVAQGNIEKHVPF